MRSLFVLPKISSLIAISATIGFLVTSLAVPAMATTVAPPFPVVRANDPCLSIGALVNRPTNTNTVCTVAPNHALLEVGYAVSRADGVITSTYPQALLRLGSTVKNLEIQITAPSWSHTRANGISSPAALGDSQIGARYFISASKRYAHSVQYSLSLPTGDPTATSGASNSSFAYQGSYQLNAIFAATAMLQQSSLVGVGSTGSIRYSSFDPSLELTAALPKDYTVFIEGATFTHPLGQGTSKVLYQTGLTKALGKQIQIDVEYGITQSKAVGSSNSTAQNYGAGIAFYL